MTLLARLNDLRTAANMRPLKSWKASNAKLHEAIAALTPANRNTSWVADIFRDHGVDPKVGRALSRRRFANVRDLPDTKENRKIITELAVESAARRAA